MPEFNPIERNPLDFTLPRISFRERLSAALGLAVAQPSILAVDISHWNGAIDWPALRASGVEAVIMKCSEGAEGTIYEYKDIKFEKNWRAALDNDFPVMVYHFSRGYKGNAEFSWFQKCADAFMNDQRILGKTAVWLDCEWKPASVSTSAYSNRSFGFCSLAEGTGYRQGIYSSPGLVPQLFYDPANDVRWNDVFQWNAHWTSAVQDTLPAGWSEAMRKAWQFGIHPTHDWTPVVNGAGTVDVNHLYFASATDLRRWMGQAISSPSASESPSPSSSPSPSPSGAPDCCEEHAARLLALEGRVSWLEGAVSGMSSRVDALYAIVSENTDSITTIKLDIEGLQQQITTLDASLQSLGQRVDVHGTDINLNTAAIATLRADITRIDDEVHNLYKMMQGIKKGINEAIP
jgi:GH25 family lysozyme M1 (1,4-beta-N-acetylmuramidase)